MENTIEDNNIKSEEVQSIIDRMPVKWAKYVSVITAILICIVIIMGFLIRYPDTVDGQISVTARVSPVRLVANTSGRLHLLKLNREMLHAGDVIAYIESGADYRDILFLDSLMTHFTPGKISMNFPFSLKLGDVSTAYNSFIIAATGYERVIKTDIYETMRLILQRQIETDMNIVLNMGKELDIKEQIIAGSTEQLEKDRELLSITAITEDEFENKKQNHLSKEEAFLSLKSSQLTKQSDINKNKLEIQRYILEERETIEKALSELMSATNNLINMLRLWKEKYIQYATLDGELEYLDFWRENSFVASGKELFSIIPDKNDVVGEIIIPSTGAGKVKTGQTANVKINNFPYDEYGYLKGVVESVSRLSNKIETREGMGEAYQVIISFPDGMVSNYGMTLPVDFESKGTAEIITKPKRLIERLFDNLKTKMEK